jgi:hypothetical protein
MCAMFLPWWCDALPETCTPLQISHAGQSCALAPSRNRASSHPCPRKCAPAHMRDHASLQMHPRIAHAGPRAFANTGLCALAPYGTTRSRTHAGQLRALAPTLANHVLSPSFRRLPPSAVFRVQPGSTSPLSNCRVSCCTLMRRRLLISGDHSSLRYPPGFHPRHTRIHLSLCLSYISHLATTLVLIEHVY